MPKIQLGELVAYNPKIKHTLWSACRAFRFEIAGNKILVDKKEEEQHDIPHIPPINLLTPPMAERTMADYARSSITGMQPSIRRLAI